MDEHANPPPRLISQVRRLALPQRWTPLQELQRRIDGQEPHDGEERELGDERDAMEVVMSALLEMKHARQADHDDQACRDAVEAISGQDLPGVAVNSPRSSTNST